MTTPTKDQVALLYEFAGYLSVKESLPEPRQSVYPFQELVAEFLDLKELHDARARSDADVCSAE